MLSSDTDYSLISIYIAPQEAEVLNCIAVFSPGADFTKRCLGNLYTKVLIHYTYIPKPN